MDKKKIAFIVVTVLSVVVSLVACALGLPYTPVDIDYDYVSDASLPPDGDASAVWVAGAESPGADFGLCAPLRYGDGLTVPTQRRVNSRGIAPRDPCVSDQTQNRVRRALSSCSS